MKPYKVTIRSGSDKALASRAVQRCPVGYTLWFKPPTRSNVANARMWAMLDDVADQKEWAGRKWPSEAWKDLFAASLFGQELVPNLDNNGFVAFHSRTSEFSPETMSDMITLIESWGAANGVVFTDTPQAENAGTGQVAPASSPAPAADGTPSPNPAPHQGKGETRADEAGAGASASSARNLSERRQ